MTERDQILSLLRHLAETTLTPNCRGAYLYAVEEIERGTHRAIAADAVNAHGAGHD